jgi:glyoxylase-like metal-dependent hydrolase (beta-lactamase superfamily II)
MSYYFEEGRCVFVGDLIFEGSIGRTDFPGGSLEVLRSSVQDKIFTLPEDTVIYPGHGEPTSVGREKAHNPYFNEFF